MKRQMLFVLVFVMMLLWVVPAGAGGWVSITLDALPGPATAGEPLTISFMVRQHGQTPTDWAEPEIHIRSLATGENAMFLAEPTGKLGQYSAQVIFPEQGEFEWYVSATPFPQQLELPTISVAGAPLSTEVRNETANWVESLRWLSLVLLLLAALNLGREQRRKLAPEGV